MINYLDIQTPNLLGYYGVNLQRLQSVKLQYDPENFFKNPMSIPVATAENSITPASIPGVDEVSPSVETNAPTMDDNLPPSEGSGNSGISDPYESSILAYGVKIYIASGVLYLIHHIVW